MSRSESPFFQNLRWTSTALLLAAAILSPRTALGVQSVTLTWNASGSTAVSGYYVYAWEENATEPIKIDAGRNSFAAINGLKEGLRYTFQVTAYNPYRFESPPSEGLPYVVPVPMKVSPPASNAAYPGRVQFPVSPGKWYELQASTDMVNWSTIWQTGIANSYTWMDYQDTRSRYYPKRFYRLIVH